MYNGIMKSVMIATSIHVLANDQDVGEIEAKDI